jgi:hypothetical protein
MKLARSPAPAKKAKAEKRVRGGKIDEAIYKLYGLTNEEIKTIEEK